MRKKHPSPSIILLVFVVVILALRYLSNQAHRYHIEPAWISTECDIRLWSHVYHPHRLEIISSCLAVTGVLEKQIIEKDGDYHVRIRLDPQFRDLLNDRNYSAQFGTI